MHKATGLKIVALLAVLLMILVLGCTSGVAQKEYDTVKQQLATKEQEVASLQQQLQAAQAAGQQATQLQQQLTKAQQDLQAAQDKGKNVMWSTVPNAPPRATATPRPPGFTPPPPPTLPAAYTEPTQIFFYVDTVTAGAGESKYNVDATAYCVRSSTFRRGMHIVWRMTAVDTSTGKRLIGDDMDRMVLKLPHGEDINFRFGPHGDATNPLSWFWTAAWDVPPDYPLGAIDFVIEGKTKAGKTGSFKQLPVSVPARGIESRLQVIP